MAKLTHKIKHHTIFTSPPGHIETSRPEVENPPSLQPIINTASPTTQVLLPTFSGKTEGSYKKTLLLKAQLPQTPLVPAGSFYSLS